jgi:putative endonuclease
MPSNATFSVFHYIYILESFKDKDCYIGFTKNLKKRIEEHNKGLSFSTKFRLPNEQDAKRRENYLKTTQGRRFLGLRLLEYKRLLKKAFGSGS